MIILVGVVTATPTFSSFWVTIMKTHFSFFRWVIYDPKKATEISKFMNEEREGGLMYAPDKYSRVEVFDEEGYSLGYLC